MGRKADALSEKQVGTLEWIRHAAFSSHFTIEEVVEAAAASDPSDGALVFVPSLAGERSPVPDAGASGAFVGLRPGHGRGHLARAVLEGVALSIAEVIRLMRGAGIPVSDLRLTSGGAASSFWRGLISASTDLPVRAMGDVHGPALGAALLAARGGGRFKTLKDGVDAWIVPLPPTPPDPLDVTRLAGLGTTLRSVRNALRATSMPRRRRGSRDEGSSLA